MIVSLPNLTKARQRFCDNQQCQTYFCPDLTQVLECDDKDVEYLHTQKKYCDKDYVSEEDI